MFALYKTVRRLGWSRGCGTAAAVLYGLSVIGMSTFVMIRMYMLLTLLTVVLMYLIVCLMREFKPKYCILTGLDRVRETERKQQKKHCLFHRNIYWFVA